MVFLIVTGVIFLALIGYMISSYNNFVYYKALVEEAWSGIDVQLKRRYDLIPNLVEVVKGYSIHEKNIIHDIVTARAASMGAVDITKKERAELSLTNSLKSLFALAENYPNLKANENFLELQQALRSIEEELQLARRYYNGAVRQYMVRIKTFPRSLIANIGNFEPVSYFELTNAEERNNVSIKF